MDKKYTQPVSTYDSRRKLNTKNSYYMSFFCENHHEHLFFSSRRTSVSVSKFELKTLGIFRDVSICRRKSTLYFIHSVKTMHYFFAGRKILSKFTSMRVSLVQVRTEHARNCHGLSKLSGLIVTKKVTESVGSSQRVFIFHVCMSGRHVWNGCVAAIK